MWTDPYRSLHTTLMTIPIPIGTFIHLTLVATIMWAIFTIALLESSIGVANPDLWSIPVAITPGLNWSTIMSIIHTHCSPRQPQSRILRRDRSSNQEHLSLHWIQLHQTTHTTTTFYCPSTSNSIWRELQEFVLGFPEANKQTNTLKYRKNLRYWADVSSTVKLCASSAFHFRFGHSSDYKHFKVQLCF